MNSFYDSHIPRRYRKYLLFPTLKMLELDQLRNYLKKTIDIVINVRETIKLRSLLQK